MFAKFSIGAVIAERAKSADYIGSTVRARRAEQGRHDRFNGQPPLLSDADYFRGYCEAVCDEIVAEIEAAGRNNRACWWGEAD